MSEVKPSDFNIFDFLNNQKMSAAVMSSPVYDFGDLFYKHHHQNNSNNNARSTIPQHNINLANVLQQQQQSSHQKVLRWGDETAQRAVGAPTPHQSLSRRNSTPVHGLTDALVNSVNNMLLDNIQEQAAAVSASHRKLDRSQSEPSPSALLAAAAAANKAANINTSRYKTELCRPFEESGSCKYGDKCQFAHGHHELRNLVRHPKYKTELCRTFHTIGFCPYGPRCHFIHNAEEARVKFPQMQGGNSRQPAGIKPLYLGLGSTAESPSPTSSLSQSPTNSVGSFFSSETDIFQGQGGSSASPPPPAPQSASSASTAFSFGGEGFQPLVIGGGKTPPCSPSPTGSPPPGSPDARLPVFNNLSSKV